MCKSIASIASIDNPFKNSMVEAQRESSDSANKKAEGSKLSA